MTTIERIYAAIVATMDGQGRRSVDPFSFDHDPRDSETAWYVDPPSTVSSGAVGGVETVTATFVLWISRPAADDAAGAAVALAGSLARLRHRLAAMDVDPLVNVQPVIRIDIRPRDADAVTVVARIVLTLDFEADEANP